MKEGCGKELFRKAGEHLAYCGQTLNCKLRLCRKCKKLKDEK